ncbi:MAG: hypothetical protein QOH57_3360, partial [Mycobacterium sp.]|nr:hypothetical protein [Mycobacterium sp.]
MQPALRIQPSGLVAVARTLREAAAQLGLVDAPEHPPLARDQTSVAAAARLNTSASTLQTAAAQQAAGLVGTAHQFAAIAAAFTEQESLNASAVRNLASSHAVTPIDVGDPPPPMPADNAPPIPPPVVLDGETASRQLHAGSSSAGDAFIQRCRAASAAATTTLAVVLDALPVLPELWSSPAGVEATTARLAQHAAAIAAVGARAAALADQADSHSRAYRSAVAATPPPEEFETARAQLAAAVRANA